MQQKCVVKSILRCWITDFSNVSHIFNAAEDLVFERGATDSFSSGKQQKSDINQSHKVSIWKLPYLPLFQCVAACTWTLDPDKMTNLQEKGMPSNMKYSLHLWPTRFLELHAVPQTFGCSRFHQPVQFAPGLGTHWFHSKSLSNSF